MNARENSHALAEICRSVAATLEISELSTAEREAFRLCCRALSRLETEAQQIEVARLLLSTARLSEAGASVVMSAVLAEHPTAVLEAALATMRSAVDPLAGMG